MKICYIYTVFCEWVCWSRVRCVFNLKFLPHLVHLKGSSPVWLFWWHASSESKIKLSVHVLGSWGFSPLWVLWWEISSEVEWKVFEHSGHFKGLNFENESNFPSIAVVFRLSLWPLPGRDTRAAQSISCWDCTAAGRLTCAFPRAKQDLFSDQHIYRRLLWQCGFSDAVTVPGAAWTPFHICHTYGFSPSGGSSCAETGVRAGGSCCHTVYTYMASCQCGFSCELSGWICDWKSSRGHHIYTFSFLHVFSDAKRGMNYHWSFGHIQDTCMTFWFLLWEIEEFWEGLWFLNFELVLSLGCGFQW